MRLERVRSMSCKKTFPGAEQAWEPHDTGNEPDVCVFQSHLSNCVFRRSPAPLPLSFLSLFFSRPSIPSQHTHHRLMMTTARLEASLRQAGWRPIRFGLWWVGPLYLGPHHFTTGTFWRPLAPHQRCHAPLLQTTMSEKSEG